MTGFLLVALMVLAFLLTLVGLPPVFYYAAYTVIAFSGFVVLYTEKRKL